MDVKTALIKFWINKKLRNGVILGILLIALISIILYQISNVEEPPPPGAIRMVICDSCKKTIKQRVYKIKEAICENCKAKGSLHYAWKCGSCQYEYYPKPYEFKTEKLNTMQRFQKVEESRACPNCGEPKDIGPMAIQ